MKITEHVKLNYDKLRDICVEKGYEGTDAGISKCLNDNGIVMSCMALGKHRRGMSKIDPLKLSMIAKVLNVNINDLTDDICDEVSASFELKEKEVLMYCPFCGKKILIKEMELQA